MFVQLVSVLSAHLYCEASELLHIFKLYKYTVASTVRVQPVGSKESRAVCVIMLSCHVQGVCVINEQAQCVCICSVQPVVCILAVSMRSICSKH